MSLLTNQGWLGLSGEPVTGRVPPQLIMMEGVLTPQQYAQVAHAYQMFCMGKLTSVTDYLVANRTLADGTKVRCESMQGMDRVLVWAKGTEDQDVFPPHGIGVIFTDLADAPVEPYTRIKKNTVAEKEPQPLILVPGARKAGGKIISDGKWKVRKASKLVGGQRLWVAPGRRKWMSIFAWFTDIYGNYEPVGPAEPDPTPEKPIPDQRVWAPQTEWTPSTFDRIAQASFKRYGKYVMRSNEAFGLMYTPAVTPPFLAELNDPDGNSVPHVAHLIATEGAIYFGKAPYKLRMGADPAAFANVALPAYNSAPEFTLTPNGLWSIPAIPNFVPMSGTISVHPSGTRALVMVDPESTVRKKSDGAYAEIAIGKDSVTGVKKIDPEFANPAKGTASGGTTSYAQRTVVPYTAPYEWELGGFTGTAVREDGFSTSYAGSYTTNTSYSKTTVSLVRAYFGLGGDEVFERLRTVEAATELAGMEETDGGSSRGSGSRSDVSRWGTGLEISPGYSDGAMARTEFSDRVTTLTGTLELTGRKIKVQDTRGTISSRRDVSVTKSLDVPSTTTVNATAHTTVSDVVRTVLHWDKETNFIIYTEFNASVDSFKTYGTGEELISETHEQQAKYWLKAEYGDKTILEEMLVELPVGPPGGFFGGLAHISIMSSTSFTDGGMQPYETSGVAWVGAYPNQVAQTVPNDPVRTCWSGGTITSVQTATGGSFSRPLITQAPGVIDPARYCEVRFVRDPVTFASVVNLTFYGTDYGSGLAYKNWMWAVDHVSAKPLKDVLKVAADIQVSKQFSLNSLVSI